MEGGRHFIKKQTMFVQPTQFGSTKKRERRGRIIESINVHLKKKKKFFVSKPNRKSLRGQKDVKAFPRIKKRKKKNS